jgi:hypothetical protein
MWSPLMPSSLVVFVTTLVKYFHNFESDLTVIDPLVLLSSVSFVLFYIRLYLGGTNFNKIAGEIGINTIFHSHRFQIKNKRAFDAIFLCLQGTGFVFLALYVNKPELFLKIFLLNIVMNIFWLHYQQYCLTLIIDCITIKFQTGVKKYTIEEFTNKVGNKIALKKVVTCWLVNNLVCAVMCVFFLYFYPQIGVITIKLALLWTILNSYIDLFFTWDFYSHPEKNFKL